MEAKRVIDEALLLPKEERLRLTKRLLVSLEEANSEVDQSKDEHWALEIERRLLLNKENSEQTISKETTLSNLSAEVVGKNT